jgi:hypothetical protein
MLQKPLKLKWARERGERVHCSAYQQHIISPHLEVEKESTRQMHKVITRRFMNSCQLWTFREFAGRRGSTIKFYLINPVGMAWRSCVSFSRLRERESAYRSKITVITTSCMAQWHQRQIVEKSWVMAMITFQITSADGVVFVSASHIAPCSLYTVVHYVWPGPTALVVVHYIGNMVPLVTQPMGMPGGVRLRQKKLWFINLREPSSDK